MSDKLPALPPRPKSFRAKTFDPYDDVFGYAETKGYLDTQDALIATLVAEAEISDERVAEYRDANRGLGKRIAELTDKGTDLNNKYDEANSHIVELVKERNLWKDRAISFSKGMEFMEKKTGVDADHFVFEGMKAMIADKDRIVELEREIRKLKTERDMPETEDFFKGVPLEAAHQRGRWGNEHDSGKEPQDWFWLVGYLAGKCLASVITEDRDKALHHTISTAAALANWHIAIKGNGNMRPGIETSVEERNAERGNNYG